MLLLLCFELGGSYNNVTSNFILSYWNISIKKFGGNSKIRGAGPISWCGSSCGSWVWLSELLELGRKCRAGGGGGCQSWLQEHQEFSAPKAAYLEFLTEPAEISGKGVKLGVDLPVVVGCVCQSSSGFGKERDLLHPSPKATQDYQLRDLCVPEFSQLGSPLFWE